MPIKVSTTAELPFEGSAILVVGQFKSGKTVLGHSASRHAPIPLTPKVTTVLPDVGYICLEPNGHKSAQALGLVAKHALDLSTAEYRAEQDLTATIAAGKGAANELQLSWPKVHKAILEYADYVKANPEIRVVVFDHLTRLSDCLEAHYRDPKFGPKTSSGQIDTFAIYRQIKEVNQWLASVFFGCKVLFIALAQVKAVSKEADEVKLASKSVGGDSTDLIPQLPTATAGFWSGYADAVISTLRKKVKVGAETRFEHKMVMTSSNRLPSGNRFGLVGEHDSHLGPIINQFYRNL